MAMQCLLRIAGAPRRGRVTVHLRFLQLQARDVERLRRRPASSPVAELQRRRPDAAAAGTRRSSRRSTARRTLVAGSRRPGPVVECRARTSSRADADGDAVGRIVRAPVAADRAGRRRRLEPDDGLPAADRRGRQRRTRTPVDRQGRRRSGSSLIGAHLLLEAARRARSSRCSTRREARAAAAAAATRTAAGRCWPAPRARPTACSASPIILYDHPEVAAREPGRAVRLHRDRRDPHPAGDDDDRRGEGRGPGHRPAGRATIIDRCDAMSAGGPAAAARRPARPAPTTRRGGTRPTDASVDPDTDAVVDRRRRGVARAAWSGCIRRAGPTRRTCSSPTRSPGSPPCCPTSTAATHVAVVLVDDPAADLHDWYGRYLYFAPDELEPAPPTRGEPHHEKTLGMVTAGVATGARRRGRRRRGREVAAGHPAVPQDALDVS